MCREGIWNIKGWVEDDNEAMQSVFAEYLGYYSHLYNVAQFMHCKQRRHRRILDSGGKE